jgi:hypothetical protein
MDGKGYIGAHALFMPPIDWLGKVANDHALVIAVMRGPAYRRAQ